MKARVNTFLNIRTGTPEILPNNNPNDLFLKPGDIIEIAETVTGEEYKKNNIWYKLTDGAFVWSGGVDKPNVEETGLAARSFASVVGLSVFDSTRMSWAHDSVKNGGLGIVDLWKDSGVAGEKVRVAILDKGVDLNHDDLKQLIFNDFFELPSNNKHGTEMSGIIGGKGNKVFGIAPKCEMLFAKVNFNNSNSIIKALRWVNEMEADIISMSFSCGFNNDIEAELKNCFNKNVAVIAAVGNAGESNEIVDEYPSSSRFSFGIGCFGKDFKRTNISNITSNLKLLGPSQEILTTEPGNNLSQVDGDTSIATAFTSGIVALLLSVARKKEEQSNAKEIMEKLCKNPDKRNNADEEHNDHYGFGLIDPFKTYLTIK